ncbi:cysteine desulfurase [Thozetella sp. PMI_491]|nr:cysteine desulfurase [Thozetella sp. PMI_491]
MATEAFNIDDVRGRFPALKGDQVYFDNAGGSQALGTVAERIHDYLLTTNVQLGASYRIGQRSTERYDEGQAAAAKYVNAAEDEIVLGASTTTLFRLLSFTLNFDAGDEIVVSAVDHEANIASWVDLAKRQNLQLKWWMPNASRPDAKTNPKLLAEDLKGLLGPKTRLVTLTHASNILGTIQDIKAIAQVAHANNPDTLVAVDAVAYAPHRKIDVKELGVDFYAFSWYKVYGPHISMLYASTKAQEQMTSLGHFFNPHKTLVNKIGLAGASYELVYGVPPVLEYLNPATGPSKWDGIIIQESLLQETLLNYLNSRGDITVWGETSADSAVRVPTISFTIDGWSSRELVEQVEKDTNFGFRWGSFYSVRLVEEILKLSKEGVIRVSMVHYNTVEEVKGLIVAIDKVLSRKQ